jgi:hypothetical protein
VSEFGEVAVNSIPAANIFLGPFAKGIKLQTGLHHHMDSELRRASKKFREGLPKHVLQKNIFRKKGVPTMGI